MQLKTLFSLYFVVFVSIFGFATMVVVFTPMLMQPQWNIVDAAASLHFRVISLGILLGLYPLGQCIAAPWLVHLSNKYGRKPIFLVSLLVTSFAYAGIAACLHFHLFLLLFGCVFLAGLSESNLAIAECSISDFALPHHHRRLLTYIHVVWSLGYLCAALIAGVFTDSALIAWFQLSTPFLFMILLMLLGICWIFVFFKETKEKESLHFFPSRNAFFHFFTAFAEKKMRFFYVVNFFFYLAIFGFLRSYPLHLVDRLHLSIGGLAKWIVWATIPIIITDFWIVDWAKRKFSAKSLLIFFGGLSSISMLSLTFPVTEGAVLWIVLFLAAFGIGCCLPICPFFISHKSKKELYGEVLAHDESLRTGAEAIATLTFGLLAAVFIPFPLIIFSFAALIAVLLLVFQRF